MLTIRCRLLRFRRCAPEICRRHLLRILPPEELFKRLVDPLLVLYTRCRVPPIKTIELNADSISLSTFDKSVVFLTDLFERIQTPADAHAYEAENRGEVIREYYACKPATVDQPGGLENLVFLLQELRCALRIVLCQRVWVNPCATFVDVKQLARNVLNL